MKKHFGDRVYVQSAGIAQDMEIDGFVIAVCSEIGIELSRHRTRVMNDDSIHHDNLASFDLVVALSQGAHNRVLQSVADRTFANEYWPISDPTTCAGSRLQRLDCYRRTRDEISSCILNQFGITPTSGSHASRPD